MMEADGESHGAKTFAALIARGKALMATEPNYARFLIYTARATDPDDLAPYGAAPLDAELRRSFAMLEKRGDATHYINFSLPDVLALDAPEVIDIFSPDMPFIVDSVLAAIRARGGVVRLMSHPVVPFDARAHRVLNEPNADSRQESFLHLHIDALPDEAARTALGAEIGSVLDEVARAVRGWRPTLERLRQIVQDFRENPTPVEPAVLNESIQFLGWLADHNFTFLGLREYALAGSRTEPTLVPLPNTGIGLLEDPEFRFLRQGTQFVEMTPEHLAFLASPEPLLVTKANVRSRVHRRSHLDYVGIKLYGPTGTLTGEIRIVGLFTSAALAVPNAAVPLIRRKVAAVLARSGLSPRSHAGKGLLQALETYPRDELFQIEIEQLFEFATVIAALPDRPRVRVLPRLDRFDNFVSILLFMPRERYNSDVRARIGDYFARRYDGRVSAYYPHFPEGELVRVHFIIGRTEGPTPNPEREDLERDIETMIRNFGDRLLEAASDPAGVAAYRNAFSPAYEATMTPEQALNDIALLADLGDDIAISLEPAPAGGTLGLKVYHRGAPIALSDRVPLLENFGFRVIDEETYVISPAGGPQCYLHAMVLALPAGQAELDDVAASRIEEALLAVWHDEAESDLFNQLSVRAGLDWDDVAILRALARYLKQLGFAGSQRYIAATLAAHTDAAAALIGLFHALHDPAAGSRGSAADAARATINGALEKTRSLDEDRIIRRLLNLVEAAMRTNFYQRDKAGGRRPALGIKFACHQVDDMPEPRPEREIFVCSPRVEGLHLRFGPVARGGIRWSDRPEDFRTEVLGLVKAQQVKNAIIVPVGAKGAFVPKRLPAGAGRDAVQAEGIGCYRIFISTLLDLTDNIVGDDIVAPVSVVRRDADDPYLVVAADKGTASFSDIANALAGDRGFWLGDAFASGGSVGYDHKKMGITARGAWEAVRRHFGELGRDIQQLPFTVAGVGDMSGDVFGNGMLLSPATRLVAAFDHRDIFIDPDPDPATGLAERRRLFELPRSSWQDYNAGLLSRGGGIFSRSLKTVDLSIEARRLLNLAGPLTPQDVIIAILKAEVDLLWFGGIGTYVRGAAEADFEVGDKANDAIRITGADVRATVVGEGANLAMTQHGRVDYALRGGRLDTDAIDNSAGVNASDLEVNIKIALGALVANTTLTLEQRNAYLAALTPEVAALCLRNNYLQTLALSLAERGGVAVLPEHRTLIEYLEARGQLSRAVEFLPDDTALAERASAGRGLTRPELAVLLAYAKNSLRADLLASGVPDDPYLARELFNYFPNTLGRDYPESIAGHRLRRQVIATVLANAMINQGGPSYVVAIMGMTSADAAATTFAYAAARDAFRVAELNRQVDRLDGTVPGTAQLALYAEVAALLRRQTLWFLRNESFDAGLSDLVARHERGVAEIREALPHLLPAAFASGVTARAAGFEAGGAPHDLARRFAELTTLSLSSDIVLVATRADISVTDTAVAYFGVLELFGLGRILDGAAELQLTDRFERMALDRGLANLFRAGRDLTADVLAAGDGQIAGRLAAWQAARTAAVARVAKSVAELLEGDITIARLSVAAGLLSDLARGT